MVSGDRSRVDEKSSSREETIIYRDTQDGQDGE